MQTLVLGLYLLAETQFMSPPAMRTPVLLSRGETDTFHKPLPISHTHTHTHTHTHSDTHTHTHAQTHTHTHTHTQRHTLTQSLSHTCVMRTDGPFVVSVVPWSALSTAPLVIKI